MNSEDTLKEILKEINWDFMKISSEARDSLISLIGERQKSTSTRHYGYTLPGDLSESFYFDNVSILLFSNGICTYYYTKGNVDHNSSDYRLGVYEEDESQILLKTCSLDGWGSIIEHLCIKNEDKTLTYDDTIEGKTMVQIKVLVPSQ
jgi:hypothetical protein